MRLCSPGCGAARDGSRQPGGRLACLASALGCTWCQSRTLGLVCACLRLFVPGRVPCMPPPAAASTSTPTSTWPTCCWTSSRPAHPPGERGQSSAQRHAWSVFHCTQWQGSQHATALCAERQVVLLMVAAGGQASKFSKRLPTHMSHPPPSLLPIVRVPAGLCS